ncbi:hypothetical protein [Streptomyces sp. NPDC059452]|uniref:hypothetical protein n=1 Tax=Streptomyces sp. NPDC059452 TaxID=3346835 RepID=UPI00369618F5
MIERTVLQCTAVTGTPIVEALVALADMEEGPDDPREALARDFLLCELGEHDESTEHAAHLCAAEGRYDRDLWFMWAGSETHRVYRFAALSLCPATLHDFDRGSIRQCLLFFGHRPRTHSFHVTDPLGALITEDTDES